MSYVPAPNARFALQSSRDSKRQTQRAQRCFESVDRRAATAGFAPDWLAAYVDPSGYLEPYRRLTPAEQANDLVLREATGDRYWLSEYEAKGRPVPFHCGLIIHFIEHGSSTTEVQVYEVIPTVWVGEHWAMSKEGLGFGKYHDIRFVDPTVRDRVAVLDFVEGMGDVGRGMGEERRRN